MKRITPALLRRNAEEHLMAYRDLKCNCGVKGSMYLLDIRYFLLCRCLELFFKSIILEKEVFSANDLKQYFGHDLVKLAKGACVYMSLITLNKQERSMLEVLNGYYKYKLLEYPEIGSRTYPAIGDVEAFCERFVWVIPYKKNTKP